MRALVYSRWKRSVFRLLSLSVVVMLGGCEAPEKLPSDPREAVKLGWRRLASAEYDEAAEAFQHAASRATPGSREQLMARFALANTHQNCKPNHDYEAAAKIYAELATADRGGEIGSWSALALVRMKHLQLYEVGAAATLPSDADLNSVRNAYEKVAADFPNTDAADEANVYVGASYIEQISDAN